MAGRGSKGRKKHPQRRPRRSRFQRMGAWLPVGIIGVGAVAIVVVVVLVSSVARSSDTNVTIPERTVSAQGRTLGPDKARVTINEYSDFQCPFCARAARTMDPNIEQDYVADGRVKLVFQPVAFIGDESVAAAEAAECANDQGKFWEYHDKLFENQHGENKGGFSTEIGRAHV
jgi:protein-disulfide isomerase